MQYFAAAAVDRVKDQARGKVRYRKSVSRMVLPGCATGKGKDLPAHTQKTQLFRLGQRSPDRAHLVACLGFPLLIPSPCQSPITKAVLYRAPNLPTTKPPNHPTRGRKSSDRTMIPREQARNVWNRKARRPGSDLASTIPTSLGERRSLFVALEPWDSAFTVSPVDWKPVSSSRRVSRGSWDRATRCTVVNESGARATLDDLWAAENSRPLIKQVVSMLSSPLWEFEFASRTLVCVYVLFCLPVVCVVICSRRSGELHGVVYGSSSTLSTLRTRVLYISRPRFM